LESAVLKVLQIYCSATPDTSMGGRETPTRESAL
jgi:hypothetical protein